MYTLMSVTHQHFALKIFYTETNVYSLLKYPLSKYVQK